MSTPLYFQRPLIPLALTAFAGCLAAAYVSIPAWLALSLGLSAVAAALFWRRTRWALLFLCGAAFFVYWCLAVQMLRLPPDDISRWLPRRDIRLEGQLASLPTVDYSGRGWVGIIDCAQVMWRGRRTRASGQVRCHFPGPMPSWNSGDEIWATGRLEGFAEPGNPGEFDYARFMRNQGIHASLRGQTRADAVRVQAAPRWSAGSIAGGLHRRLQFGIKRFIPAESRDLVVSLVLGDRSGLSRRLQESMAAAGLAHILAVSGMNVSLVFATLFGLARWLRVFPRPAILLGLGGVAIFTLAAGGSASVTRAALMAGGVALGFLSGRATDPDSGLALAGLLILAWQPLAAFDAGFQLSFAATASILRMLPVTATPKTLIARTGFWLGGSLRVTGAALLGTAPLALYYFYALAPVALLSNLLALPLVTVATDGGLLVGLVGGQFPLLSHTAGRLTGWAGEALKQIAAYSEGIPYGRLFLWPPAGIWVLGVYAAELGLCAKWQRQFCAGLLVVCLMVYPQYKPAGPAPDEVRVTFLDLAGGESTLVETGSSRRWLIDTGSENEFLWRVKGFLASRGINTLDALLVSHWDDDHAGGVEACTQLLHVPQVFHAGFVEDWRGRRRRQQAMAAGVPLRMLRRGDDLELADNVRLQVVWPPSGVLESANQECLVARLECNHRDLLFTGDSPAAVERQWFLPRHCALLKVAHHGSRNSSCAEFLLQAGPDLAVAMPGSRNAFGFPSPEACRRLRKYAGEFLDTGARGAIEVSITKSGDMRWRSWK